VAARDGARVAVARLPFPAVSEDDLLERIVAAATDRTRLAIISHVTSPTALVLPVDRIVRELADRGIDTLVDGAHAPGMLPLDLDALGAAYYAANLHKWVCAPKGAAFLHVRRDRQAAVRPATISHGANAPEARKVRFRSEFDWQGTLDPTAWLAVPAALETIGGLVEGGWPAVMARNHELAIESGRAVAAVTGTRTSPESVIGSMVALPLPVDGPLGGAPAEDQSSPLEADPLQTAIYDRFAIEVPIGPFPVPAAESPVPPMRVIRVSIALHNDRDDVDRLVAALATIAAEG
jgi:isopenicillin-N epimerase